jgi:cysteinyl-tRNA synthetase
MTAMELKLYDTLTREKRAFTPIDPNRVRMYVCGVTVYDYAHIGNARPAIVFDVLFRLLRHLYGADHVTYVRNVTDVDDKINARAAERGIAIRALTEETYGYYQADVRALGCLDPTVEPRATDHIDQMKQLIERLVASGHAYVADDHVLFDVPSMPDYGKLSRRPLDEMIAGARIEVAPYKRDAMDFVLWKPSKPGEPSWPSPCGIVAPGRPGWHIECSAMAWKHLGEVFDIHGGGIDLVFPHHENEIAQSRCAFHTGVMANYWMHNGFLQLESEKMSKSVGNIIKIRELLRRVYGGVLRFNMLKKHYRQPQDWTELSLQQSRRELVEWSEFCAEFPGIIRADQTDTRVVEALADDLDTPEAITRLRDLFRHARSDPFNHLPKFITAAEFLGIKNLDKPGYFRSAIAFYASDEQVDRATQAHELGMMARTASANGLPEATSLLNEISLMGGRYELTTDGDIRISFAEESVETRVERLITLRNAARAARNWEEADRIRREIESMGVALKDTKDGTTWEIGR